MSKKLFIALFLIVGLSGCAKGPQDVTEAETSINGKAVSDPFEEFNRAMWSLNYDVLDPFIVRPVSLAYVDYVPDLARTGISNFLDNLSEPVSMVNSMIMLKPQDAGIHFNRIWMNTFFGIGGLVDFAAMVDLPDPSEKAFGDSIGYYGAGHGPFLMLPLYGPLTLREGVGDYVDGLYPPLSLLTFWQRAAKFVLEGMEQRADAVKQEPLLEDSPDPYIFVRNAYLQNKEFRATGGKISEEEELEGEEYLDEFLDEID